jgi:hypothetical protein
MSYYIFGPIKVAKVGNSEEFEQILDDPWLKSKTIIVKPNWVNIEPGGFTDARSMRMLFEALDSKIVVTESYSFSRIIDPWEQKVSIPGMDKVVDWSWFLKGDGWNWLMENPGWDWFRNAGQWDLLRKADKHFRDEFGFTDLFQEFDVDYVNVTEEAWNGRITEPAKVRNAVEQRYSAVEFEELYGMVPESLYKLRSSTFISFARLKQYVTFTLKNMFGMIIDPVQPRWHGKKDVSIVSNIVDINKVYGALFNMYGICESIHQTAVPDPKGEYKALNVGNYSLIDGLGVVTVGRDLVSLDSILSGLTKNWIIGYEDLYNRSIERAMEQGLGRIDNGAINDARKNIGNWFTF